MITLMVLSILFFAGLAYLGLKGLYLLTVLFFKLLWLAFVIFFSLGKLALAIVAGVLMVLFFTLGFLPLLPIAAGVALLYVVLKAIFGRPRRHPVFITPPPMPDPFADDYGRMNHGMNRMEARLAQLERILARR